MFLYFWPFGSYSMGILQEIFWFGVVISGVMYGFICKFMNFGLRKDVMIWKRFLLILRYIGILITEIIKANVTTMRLLFQSGMKQNQCWYGSGQHCTRVARVLLANSITLTPGTITVTLEGDELTVHCPG